MIARVGLGLTLVVLAGVILPNVRSLYEGIFFYLRDTLSYDRTAVQPVDRSGRYASIYELVRLNNAGRRDLLLQQLASAKVSVTQIAVAGSPIPDLFVRFNSVGPYILYTAHYDKLYDNAVYEGASDNTAAVGVLLASVQELARQAYTGPAAFVFTSAEETGLHGSEAFLEYARSNRIRIRENVNFDNIGRGKLAIRPSVQVPGFTFTLPLLGDWTYDGRELRASPPYRPANVRLTEKLLQVQPDIVVYERFTALSDSNVFQANNIDTVAISGDDMRYLELTWHTYADRVELLDERNLDAAFRLILQYAQQ